MNKPYLSLNSLGLGRKTSSSSSSSDTFVFNSLRSCKISFNSAVVNRGRSGSFSSYKIYKNMNTQESKKIWLNTSPEILSNLHSLSELIQGLFSESQFLCSDPVIEPKSQHALHTMHRLGLVRASACVWIL